MIYGIWAEDKNGLIGKENRLPWHLPAELQHFKQTTMNQAILMGRKTFEGMKRRVLPGRLTIVLTHDLNLRIESPQVLVLHSLDEVLRWYETQEKALFVIGGAEVLQLFEPYLEQLYRTIVQAEFDGDAYFPPNFDFSKFQEQSSEFHEKDEKNSYAFIIKKYKRVD